MYEKSIYIFYPTSKKFVDNFLRYKNEFLTDFSISNYPPTQFLFDKKSDFMNAFCDKANHCLVIPWLGGKISLEDYSNSSLEIVESLTEKDWMIIKGKTETNLVGYSDITVLHCAMLNHEMCSIYGPNCYSLCKSNLEERKFMLHSIYRALNRDGFCIELGLENQRQTIVEGVGTGRLIGGNLHTLFDLQKNKPEYMVKRQPNDLIFIEDIEVYYQKRGKNISSLQSYRYKYLKEHGFFDKISGLIIGRTKYPHIQYGNHFLSDTVAYEEEIVCIEDILHTLCIENIPIIANVPCGHVLPMLSLPLGRICTLDSTNRTLEVHQLNC